MSSQRPLLRTDHGSLQPSRLKKDRRDGRLQHVNAERVYAAEWKRQNKYVSHEGWPFLALVLRRDDGRPCLPSRRDAAVAASVIQWLGTNVGSGFVMTCERKIDAARDALDKAADRRLLDQQRERMALKKAEFDERYRRPSRRGLLLKKGDVL